MERFSHSLVEEGLKDAAETFFGLRKDLEEEIGRFKARVEELHNVDRQVVARCAVLAELLGDRETLERFWRDLGVQEPGAGLLDPCFSCEPDSVKIPWRVTRAGRYAATVCRAYENLESTVREYMDGVYHDDPAVPGRKVKTVNYRGLAAWSRVLNQKITEVNSFHSPSEAMQFAKKMDVEAQNRENVAGAPLQYTLDRDMSFAFIDFSEVGLPVYPGLPRPDAVRKSILRLAKARYAGGPESAWRALRRVAATQE